METKVKIWHQSFSMEKLEPIVKYHETTIDIPVSPEMTERMMRIAIVGEKDFDEELKKSLRLDNWNVSNDISQKLHGKTDNAYRVLFSFKAMPSYVYVWRNIIGKIKNRKESERIFAEEEDLTEI